MEWADGVEAKECAADAGMFIEGFKSLGLFYQLS
jgi:hypothetical protein